MSTTPKALIAYAASAALLCLAVQAEDIGTAWMTGTPIVHKGAEKGGACAYVTDDSGRKALKVSWASKRGKWLDVSISPFTPVSETSGKLAGTLEMAVFADGTDEVSEITPRLIDAKGEIFQWRLGKPLNLSKPGWTTLSYTVGADNFKDSWGKAKTGLFKDPAKFLGCAISFKSETGSPGSIMIGKISFTGAGEDVAYSEGVYKFDDSEKWTKLGAKDENAAVAQKDGGLALNWLFQNNRMPYAILLERKNSLEDIGSPERLILEMENSAGLATEQFVVVRDFKGRNFLLKPRKGAAGDIKSEWTLASGEVISSWGPGEGNEMLPPLSVAELRLSVKSGAEGASTLLKSIRAEGRKPVLEALKLDVETGSPLRILKPGNGKASIVITNTALSPVEFNLDVSLRDFFGETVKSSARMIVPAGEETRRQLPFSPAKRGIWYVDYTLSDKEAKRTGTTSFCIMEPSGKYCPPGAPTPDALPKRLGKEFIFGMNTHTERWSLRDQELEVMAAASIGVKAARTGCGWEGIQPAPDVWDWATEDRIIGMYARNGIEVQPLLGFCPKWAAPENTRNSKNWLDWSRATPNIPAWRKYCFEFAKRYSGKVSTVEIWNEPDIGFFNGTQDEYVEMLKSAYEEVKRAAPSIQVMSGGFATLGYHPSSKKDFQKNVVRLGQDYFDIHANHEHCAFEAYAAIVDGALVEVRAQLKSPKPWYPNETAIASMNGEAPQAVTLIQKMVFSMARGAIGYNWYDLRNDGWNPKDGEHNYGLVTLDFHPKSAYVAYNTLTSVMKGMAPSRQLNGTGANWAFAFSGAGSSVVVLWNSNVNGAETALVASGLAEGAKLIDIMGNEETLKVIGGKSILKVTPTPAFLRTASKNNMAPSLEPLLAFDRIPVCCPGQGFSISGHVKNPLDKETTLKLSAVMPEDIACVEPLATLALAPSGKAKFDFKAKAAETVASSGALKAKITYDLGGLWTGEIAAPIAMAAEIPPGAPATRKADFSLKDRSKVFNFSEKDPNLAHLNWTGAGDLSAGIWLGRKPGALLVKVDVTDDIHFQDQTPLAMWQADCIQMALQIPEQQGFWELGFAMDGNGAPMVFCWNKVQGFGDPASKVVLKTTPRNGGVVYEAELPFNAFELSDGILENGIKFNLIVNDNDAKGRKGWIEMAPGIGQGKNPELFPMVVFRKQR